jgi:hypothetical protein
MAQVLEFPTPDGNVQIPVREPRDIVAPVDLSSPTPAQRCRRGKPADRMRPIAALEVSGVGTAEVVKRPDGRRHIGYALMAGKEEW